MSEALEALIRDVAARGLSITLVGTDEGFSASVYRYPQPDDLDAAHLTNRRDSDAVAALRAVLVEHLRWLADVERRYAAAPKRGADGTCMICESGGDGCDACRPVPADDFGDL